MFLVSPIVGGEMLVSTTLECRNVNKIKWQMEVHVRMYTIKTEKYKPRQSIISEQLNHQPDYRNLAGKSRQE